MESTDKLTFQIIYTPEEAGGFTATVPSLPGCISYGETLEEAETMIADAIAGYLTSLQKHQEIMDEPVEFRAGTLVGTVTV